MRVAPAEKLYFPDSFGNLVFLQGHPFQPRPRGASCSETRRSGTQDAMVGVRAAHRLRRTGGWRGLAPAVN